MWRRKFANQDTFRNRHSGHNVKLDFNGSFEGLFNITCEQTCTLQIQFLSNGRKVPCPVLNLRLPSKGSFILRQWKVFCFFLHEWVTLVSRELFRRRPVAKATAKVSSSIGFYAQLWRQRQRQSFLCIYRSQYERALKTDSAVYYVNTFYLDSPPNWAMREPGSVLRASTGSDGPTASIHSDRAKVPRITSDKIGPNVKRNIFWLTWILNGF